MIGYEFAAGINAALDHAIKLGDADTADLYTENSRTVDKYLWFLEAHLQAETKALEIRDI